MEKHEQSPIGSVMVVGSGIGGIQASLDLADSGFKVYLVEKEPCIGGVMPQLDKTFPTNDCAMCILAPKLVDTGRHPNIEIVTNAEVTSLEGDPGHFKASVLKRPRYVNEELCNGCGDCSEACPVVIDSEFEEGLGKRKAIYRKYPQAIPNKFAISKSGVSPCLASCPAGCNGHAYTALVAKGELEQALRIIMETVPLPRSMGRICAHPCEDVCNRSKVDEAVSICALKRYVAENAGLEIEKDGASSGDSAAVESRLPARVAIVGAGPAGLTCAYDLALKGYGVTVFESQQMPGGMLMSGVPEYRLPKKALLDDVSNIQRIGVELKTGITVGKDVSIEDLRSEGYEAFFLATGLGVSRRLKIEGAELEGVLGGLELLKEAKTGTPPELKGRVAVVGGGNVAIDVARTAVRLDADSVDLFCLESRAEMPAYEWEIEDAVEEGVVLHTSRGPKAILGKNGAVAGLGTLECSRVFDEAGAFNPELREGTEEIFDADIIVVAIGQAPDIENLQSFQKISMTTRNTIEVDPITLEAGEGGFFAGGDAVTGPGIAVDAIAQGHRAAISIDRYLSGQSLTEGREKEDVQIAELPDRKVEKARRVQGERLPLTERVRGFDEIESALTHEQALYEASRCLNCSICCGCLRCAVVCGRDAVDHDMSPEEIGLEVGSVILAPGYATFDPVVRGEYGYGSLPNVLTSLEFERLLSASGPFKGHLVRPSDEREPSKIAWIQCVGSRDRRHNTYCSSVCCMYATKEAVIAKEHSKRELECDIYFIDMRCFGKDFDRYYERAKSEYGVHFIRARVASVAGPDADGRLILEFEDENSRIGEEAYDIVVLSTAFLPPTDAREMSRIFGVELNKHGFIKTDPLYPVETTREGVFVCGSSSEPKDIPETVTEASAAAARAAELLSDSRGSETTEKVYPPERDVSGEEPRVGVFICHCGVNIGGTVDVDQVTEYARTLPDVVYAENNLYTCSQDTQEAMRQKIEEHHLNRVVVASCTPRTHQPLFMDTTREAGLNPYLFEMTNIRDQCSWVHMKQPAEATEKSKMLLAMAVAKARRLKQVTPQTVAITQSALVIGGGLAGMVASCSLAEQGFQTYLVEREEELGGNLRRVQRTLEGEDPQKLLRKLVDDVDSAPLVEVFTGSEVTEVSGYVGNYKSRVRSLKDGQEREVEHGVIFVATGAQEYTPEEYLYEEKDNVLTLTEFEEALERDEKIKEKLGTIVFIQCVGSRCEERPYCSRICCARALKNALRARELNKDANIFVLYRDMRAYGFKEDFYREAREKGVIFVRYSEKSPPTVEAAGERVAVRFREPTLGMDLYVEPSVLVLGTGVVPSANDVIAKLLKVPLTTDGFFLEAHVKLRPVDFSADGIFVCGLAHSPKAIGETITQSLAAAGRAMTVLSKERIESKGSVVEINERLCSGCWLCVKTCPYEARQKDEEKRVATVIDVLCQGCGACAAVCPSGATQQKGFDTAQELEMVAELT